MEFVYPLSGFTLTVTSFVIGLVPPTMLTPNFKTQHVKPGASATEWCEAKGDPKPTYMWTKNGEVLSDDEQYDINPVSGTITIKRVTGVNGEGTYQCWAKNSQGTAKSGFWEVKLAFTDVNSNSQPVVMSANPVEGKEGTTANLRCVFFGNPKPTITWYKDGESISYRRLMPYVKPAITQMEAHFTESYHVISNLAIEDEGEYICRAKNKYGTDEGTVRLKVEKISKPVFQRSIVVPWDDKKMILCVICFFYGHPEPIVQWHKDGVIIPYGSLLPNGDPKYEISNYVHNIHALFINKLELQDEGDYVCRATNDYGVDEGTVRVKVPVKFKPIFQYSEAFAGKVGSSATLICVFDGKPVPSVQWRKDDVIISDESLLPNGYSKYEILSDFLNINILYIKYLELEDEGDYICRATNAYGDDKGTVRVRVTDTQTVRRPEGNSKPVFQYSRAVSGRVGSTLILLCVFDGSPLPTVQWLKDDVIIPDGTLLPDGIPKYETSSHSSNTHTLIIEHLELKDEGDYICRATNDYGVDEGTVRVTVTGDETSEKADDE